MQNDYNNKMSHLQDNKQNGKPVNWRGRKIGAWNLHRSYLRLGMSGRASRTFLCAEHLDFREYKSGELQFYRARFCMDKLCPMCAARRSDILNKQMRNVIDYLNVKSINGERLRYIFLTLTMRNVSGVDLSNAIDDIFYGFNLLTKRKEFKALSVGWMRALEVTHNWKADTYHPHIHMVIAVKESYFTEYKNYLNHDKWLTLWKSCMKFDYEPWVDVRKVKRNKLDICESSKNAISYSKAIAEITKYSTKSADYLVRYKDREYFAKEYGIEIKSVEQANDMTDRTVLTLSSALHNRRMIAFGGEIRKVHKLLNIKDVERGELNADANTDENESKPYTIVRFRWNHRIKDYLRDWSYTDTSLPVRKDGNILVKRRA